MGFITIEELKTHLYDNQISLISGTDETLLTSAIDGAIAEARGYLHNYDTDKIFSETSNRNSLLVIFIKDIAVWHYINLANPGIDLKLRQDRYNAAIAWLKGVQKGDIMPDLPVVQKDDTNTITVGSNPPRNNHI